MAPCFNDGALWSFKISVDSENNAYKVVGQSLSKIRVLSKTKSSCLLLSFTYRALSSLKIPEMPFWWILKTIHLRFRAKYEVNWHAFGSIRVLTKYSVFYFCLLTLPYHHSKFQKTLGVESMLYFGSIFGHMWNFVKCSPLPFLFTYFDRLSSKNSEQVLRRK